MGRAGAGSGDRWWVFKRCFNYGTWREALYADKFLIVAFFLRKKNPSAQRQFLEAKALVCAHC